MILIILIHILSISAKKRNDGHSTLSESRDLLEMSDKIKLVNFHGQPRFNTSCDLESLEAANECEARVLICCNYEIFNIGRIWIQIFRLKVTSDPYCKQDLKLIFSECSQNCENQPCVAECQRDFYINIDCKHKYYYVFQFIH